MHVIVLIIIIIIFFFFRIPLFRKSETVQASSNSVVEEQAQAQASNMSANTAMNGPQSPLSSSAAAAPGFTSLSVQVCRH